MRIDRLRAVCFVPLCCSLAFAGASRSLSPRSMGLRSGLYFLVLEAGDRPLVRRVTILQ